MPEWVDEVPSARPWPNQKYDWDAAADFCRTDPGRWACVAVDIPRSHAYAIRQGLKRAFQPPEDWLTRTVVGKVRSKPSRADLYLAFIGAPGARLRALKALRQGGLGGFRS